MAPIGEPRSAVLHLGGFERHRRGKALLEEAVVQLQRSEIFLLEKNRDSFAHVPTLTLC